MPDKRQATSSWWLTVPGILTGLAAIITAVTGLVVAVNALSHTGGHSEDSRPAGSSSTVGTNPASSPASSPISSTSHASTPHTSSEGVASKPVLLPEIHRVRLSGGAADYTVLSAEIEPVDAERRSLKFAVRFVNGGRFPSNFWSSSFRLFVDGVPRAPTNLLDEVVPADSGKDGDVIFEVPPGTREVVLQISSVDEKSRLPFKLP